MSSRRTHSVPPTQNQVKTRGRCLSAICASWKVFTCIFSHVMLVTLVVAYCIVGAITFAHFEAENEKSVKTNIQLIRKNLTDVIWNMTYNEFVLREDNWTLTAIKKLEIFETEILNAMKILGWDGNEDPEKIQWTFSGALFYSIIVITTIGYGHIAPKTQLGKVSTIFYAILGIPLMLLCLSNIGDIMASSFRFIYWRVCCFVCTREPKRTPSKRLRRQDTLRQQQSVRYSDRRTNPSLRRSIRISQRTADSGFGGTFYEPSLTHAFSDTELRYITGPEPEFRQLNEKERSFQKRNAPSNQRNQRFNRNKAREAFRDRHTVERDRNVNRQFYNNRFHDDFDTIPPRSKSYSQRNRRGQSTLRDVDEYLPTLPMNKGDLEMLKYSPKDLYNNVSPKTNSKRNKLKKPPERAKSLDPSLYYEQKEFELFDDTDCKIPVLCNKYAIDELDRQNGKLQNINQQPQQPDSHSERQQRLRQQYQQRSQSMPRPRYREQSELRRSLSPPPVHKSQNTSQHNRQSNQHRPHIQRQSSQSSAQHYQNYNHNQLYPPDDEIIDVPQPIKKIKRRERAPPPPSPRIMSPMGFAVHRQARLQAYYDDDSIYGDEWDLVSDIPARIRPVPIWLCVFLVISYILAGAYLFSQWEKWPFLDSVYFCFITLTTIGFGDFVPAQGVEKDSQVSIALCSLYLLFGIALLAMSFNLVQEEVIANVKNVARKLGILKEEEIDD